MIERQHGRIIFECDACSQTFEADRGEAFEDAWPRAKSDGWKAQKIGRDWIHACQDCEIDR